MGVDIGAGGGVGGVAESGCIVKSYQISYNCAMLTANDIRQKYLDFFVTRGHKVIPPAPLLLENDPTTLFTSSGMQPLIPYLLGQSHPSGKKLVDSQPSFRSQDIEDVGDNRHSTFFEMLGNWSLGDYFKKEQLKYFFDFLVEEVGLDPQKLYVTVFSGDPGAGVPKDEESITYWQEIFSGVGIKAKEVHLVTEAEGAKQGMQGGASFQLWGQEKLVGQKRSCSRHHASRRAGWTR